MGHSNEGKANYSKWFRPRPVGQDVLAPIEKTFDWIPVVSLQVVVAAADSMAVVVVVFVGSVKLCFVYIQA